MTKLDAGLITPVPASDSCSLAVWGSKRINFRPQSCLCLTWSGCPSNDDDDNDTKKSNQIFPKICIEVSNDTETQICSLGNVKYLSLNKATIFLKNSSENTFLSICINMRSLSNPKNFTKFEYLISALDFSPHINAVNETWEKPNSTG